MGNITVTLSANAGVAIQIGGKRIWVDAFHRRKATGFSTVSPELFGKILKAEAFQNPDAICYMDLEDMDDKLVSHIIPKYKEDGNYGVQPVIEADVEYGNQARYDAIYEKMKDMF